MGQCEVYVRFQHAEAYKTIVGIIGHEQDLQQVLQQESSEIQLLIACVRQVNAYMVSHDCTEDD